jgi:hypothetical protein
MEVSQKNGICGLFTAKDEMKRVARDETVTISE